MNKFKTRMLLIINKPSYCWQYFVSFFRLLKLWMAFLISLTCRSLLYKKEIWLVREKGTEARDNGYHFFKYVRENYPEINIHYVITKESPDMYKIQKYGNIIYLNTFKHYLFYLCARVSLGSQPGGASPEPTRILFKKSRKLCRKGQVVIHLKHGITKDLLSHDLDYKNAGYDLICCASERERRFMQEMHGYPDDHIKALGFCRFDNLLRPHETKKQILIMPTHRNWLCPMNVKKDATKKEKESFQNSEYYRMYESLLSDKELIQICQTRGYRIVFYPHYAQQPYISCFSKLSNESITIADREHYDVQQLLLESSLLITDFSSVFFDFAYMSKPVIFYQFDVEQYRTGHYKKGYFDYHEDGFGPVFENKSDIINEIRRILDAGCAMDNVYQKRVDYFFSVRDTNNCKRIFDEVYRKALSK